MTTPTVQDLAKNAVAERLRVLGFDGLLQEDGECGCEVDDLMPCGLALHVVQDCRAAYKVETDPTDCGCENGTCEWHMTETKPEGR